MHVLLQAAVFLRENRAGKAEEILLQQAKKNPDKSKILFLARAQVAAAAGHHQIAAEFLSLVPDIQNMPATVATLVTLKERGKQKEASRLLEELVKSHESVEAMVGLVTTAAHVNVDKAETYAKKLKPLPGLKSVDVDSLEKTSGAKHVDIKIPDTIDECKAKYKSKKKRKRKPKYPKGYDPSNPGPPPDPEAGSPNERGQLTDPKRKDKRAAQVRGSQGAVSRDKQEQVSTNNAATAKSNQAAVSSKATAAPSTSQSKALSSKSSKKKSRK